MIVGSQGLIFSIAEIILVRNFSLKNMRVALLRMHVQFPGSDSLKAKRRRLKPFLARLQKEFNVSAAEVDYQDRWQDALVACALVSNANGHAEQSLQKLIRWVDRNWRDVDLVEEQIEILQ